MEQTASYHYRVMARAIDAIERAGGQTLPLEALAAEVGLSPAHLQRVFSAWVGVSPKRFQQYLTLGHAKALLRERITTLQTAETLGLSGTSRLHDLFIRWEAMSPGDYARAGEGLESAGAGSTAPSATRWRWAPQAASAASALPPRPGATRRWPT